LNIYAGFTKFTCEEVVTFIIEATVLYPPSR